MPASAQDGSLTGDGFYVALTEQPLDVAALMQRVRSPKAGANVLFAGRFAFPIFLFCFVLLMARLS